MVDHVVLMSLFTSYTTVSVSTVGVAIKGSFGKCVEIVPGNSDIDMFCSQERGASDAAKGRKIMDGLFQSCEAAIGPPHYRENRA